MLIALSYRPPPPSDPTPPSSISNSQIGPVYDANPLASVISNIYLSDDMSVSESIWKICFSSSIPSLPIVVVPTVSSKSLSSFTLRNLTILSTF